jgi:hypothetical protein
VNRKVTKNKSVQTNNSMEDWKIGESIAGSDETLLSSFSKAPGPTSIRTQSTFEPSGKR